MNDELVKWLRDCGNDSVGCGGCPYKGRLRDGSCINGLLAEAADAIEELSVVVRAQKAVLDKFPHWIPVTERLPEKDGTFITAYSKGGVSQNWYMTFHHGGGKWYQNSEDTGEVTHWMPLPEPPKEE